MATELPDPTLTGWTFSQREVANGVWKVDAWHVDGRSVSRTGYDLGEALTLCRADASNLPKRPAHA
jgi:hypothetical protein